MKKMILSLCFVLAIAGFASAQPPGGDGMAGDRMMKMKQKLKDELQLTDVQADSVMAIQKAYQPQMRELRMDQSMSEGDKQAKMETMNAEKSTRLQSAIGKDMADKVMAYMDKMRAKRGAGMQQ